MEQKEVTEKPWTGRFTESTDAFVEAFTASVTFDQRMASYDIRGSIAHARMLAEVDVLTAEERDQIMEGLEEILEEINSGSFSWSIALEDVHMNIESRLVQKIGDLEVMQEVARGEMDRYWKRVMNDVEFIFIFYFFLSPIFD